MLKAIALSLLLAGALSAGTIEDAMNTETRESLWRLRRQSTKGSAVMRWDKSPA
jgi:hypothetical protein